ncbi:MAG TPA: methyltransferase [Deltaproteobacteria bacterium]|nr:methyltransferase [Deltaproteobacteria bacterium]
MEKGETLEALACGGLSILQKRDGYRFSQDAYLLAAFVDEKPETAVLEIGSGSGVVAILLAGIKRLSLTGVEVQEDLAAMSRRAVEMNGLGTRIRIVDGAVQSYAGPKVAAVVTNPPYRPACTGRVNPQTQKAIARHEVLLDLETLLENAYRNLEGKGRFYCVYPVWRLGELLAAMRTHRLEPKRLCLVHPAADQSAELALVMGLKDGGTELKVEAPFFIRTIDGGYSPAMQRVFAELRM